MAARLFGPLTDMDHDPFNPCIKLSVREQYILMKCVKRIKNWLNSAIQKEVHSPISLITYSTPYVSEAEDILIDDLLDDRCMSLKRGIIHRDNIYLTPHFEFTASQTISDYGVLRSS